MKKFIPFFSVLIASLSKSTYAETVGCSVMLEDNLWDLNPLRKSEYSSVLIFRDEGDYQLIFDNDNGDQEIFFNLCSHSYNPCSSPIEDESNKRQGLEDFASIYFGNKTSG